MNERQAAQALSQAIDALLLDQGSASSISADEEIRELSELGLALGEIEFEPSPQHQARIERLLRDKSRDLKEVDMETPITQRLENIVARFLPKRLTSLTAGVALACALVVLIAGGVVWRVALRDERTAPDSAPVAVSDQDVLPAPGPTAATSSAQALSALPNAVLLPLVSGPLPPQNAMLRQVRGVVQVQAEGDTWTAVGEGQLVQAGQRARTGELSSARLVFYDGSIASLGPNTEVSLDYLGKDPDDKSRVIELTQWVGETRHDVVTAHTDNARYEVHTPAGTGEAMGTSFQVLVTPDASARFSVDEGVVSVSNLDVTVVIVAGQLTTIPVNQPPSEPLFRITGEGEVQQIGATWTIAGQVFETHAGTLTIGNPQVGDWVSVDGHLAPDGARVADKIVLLSRAPENRFSLTGPVEALGDTAWTVAGQTIAVTGTTDVEAGIEIEDLVRVEGVIQQGGTLLAERITLVEERAGLPFQFTGVVQDIAADYWTISGVSIAVDADTELDAGLAAGDLVQVQGVILDEDVWLARSIQRVVDEEREFEFTGEVESMDPWLVSGIAFETRAWTEVEAGLEVGDRVRVKGQVMADGAWVASEIELLDEDDGALYVVFVGTVSSQDPWVVNGIPLLTDDDTVIRGNVEIGDLVKVWAKLLPDGTLLATRIKRIDTSVGCYSFAAIVVGVNGELLTLLGGESIDLDDGAVVEGDIAVGSIVLVAVCVDADGEITVTVIVIIVPPPLPPLPAPSPCGQCRGGLTNLTLRYVGSAPNALVQVVGKKGGLLYSGILQPGETVSFSGSGNHGKLSKDVKLVVNGWVDATLHTSCSKPVSPGVVYGSFQIVAGHSKEGGPLCVPQPPSDSGGDGGSKGSKGSKGCKGSKCP